MAIYGSVLSSFVSASAIIITQHATGNLQLALDLTDSQRQGHYVVKVKRFDKKKSVTYHQKVPECQDNQMEKALQEPGNYLTSAFALCQEAFPSSETTVPENNSI